MNEENRKKLNELTRRAAERIMQLKAERAAARAPLHGGLNKDIHRMSMDVVQSTITNALRVAADLWSAQAEPPTLDVEAARKIQEQVEDGERLIVHVARTLPDMPARALILKALREVAPVFDQDAVDQRAIPRLRDQFKNQAAESRLIWEWLECGALHIVVAPSAAADTEQSL